MVKQVKGRFYLLTKWLLMLGKR